MHDCQCTKTNYLFITSHFTWFWTNKQIKLETNNKRTIWYGWQAIWRKRNDPKVNTQYFNGHFDFSISLISLSHFSSVHDGILSDNPHLVLLFYLSQLFLRELFKSYRLIQVVPMDMSGYYGEYSLFTTTIRMNDENRIDQSDLLTMTVEIANAAYNQFIESIITFSNGNQLKGHWIHMTLLICHHWISMIVK